MTISGDSGPVWRSIAFLMENSLFLIGGAVAALVWANLDLDGYHHFVHHEFAMLAERHIDLHFLINDVAMALFFAIAAKEVWEALLPGGPLSNPKTAATPLMATAGGVLAPALIYFAGVHLLGEQTTLGRGWAIPCATDIAFSYLVARLIFGHEHPAIVFLLLLAIADDAAGLLILAAFYPQEAMHPEWLLLLTLAAIGTGLGMRRAGVKNFWWYLLIPGVLSWWSFYEAGIHAALGLVPIIPTMPGHHEDKGLFHPDEHTQEDTLSQFAAWWKNPVEMILGLFGLVNAGVVLSNAGTGTWLVLSGLVIGKPVGITLLTLIGERLFGFQRPEGMSYRHVVTLGLVAGIGFTVALFVSSAAYPEPGAIQDSVKMGALGSFLAALPAFMIGRALGIKPGRKGQKVS
tara:strand:- start:92151 stop:93362 length:1212 start_codon:yes stop_codon:yes gene_type:complete